MANSSRLKIPYPAENENPFFETFEAFVNDLDGKLLAAREDRNSVLFGGGTFTFGASSGVLSWSEELSVFSPLTGFRITVAAGSLTVQDGELFMLNLTRTPTSNVVTTLSSANFIAEQPQGDFKYLVGLRIGNRIYFRNGRTLSEGEAGAVLQTAVTGGASQTAISASSYTILASDETILVSPSAATGLALSLSPLAGKRITVKDDNGTAGVNNITVTATPNNIDGSATAVISSNWGVLRLRGNGTRWNVV